MVLSFHLIPLPLPQPLSSLLEINLSLAFLLIEFYCSKWIPKNYVSLLSLS